MKDSVKFLIPPPPGSSRNIVDPPSLFVKISCDHPQTTTTKSLLGFSNDVVRHAKVIIALASWGSGAAVRSSEQSLKGGPGVGSHISSENPGVSNSKNGLYWESLTITLVIVWLWTCQDNFTPLNSPLISPLLPQTGTDFAHTSRTAFLACW